MEFFTLEKASECFSDFKFSKPRLNNDVGDFDLIGKNQSLNAPDLAVEVKYRKNAFETLRNDIIYLYERLSKYNSHTNKDNTAVLVVFTDGGTSDLQKLEYRFQKYIDELFPNYVDKIRFAPVYVGNLHFLVQTFEQIKRDFSPTKKKITEFKFLNQTINPKYPEIDDHYFNQVFDLNEHQYTIIVKLTSAISHWRLGLKFSKDNSFPNRIFRHSEGNPLFHLEKNADSKPLMISYYGPDNKQEFTRITKIPLYKTQTISIKLTRNNGVSTIDVLNSDQSSILNMPVNIHDCNWAILFAWADNRNPFEIEATIEESSVDTI